MFGDITMLTEPGAPTHTCVITGGAPGMFDAEALVVVVDTRDDTFVVDAVAEAIPCALALVFACMSHIATSLSGDKVGVGAGEGRGSCKGTGRGGRGGT